MIDPIKTLLGIGLQLPSPIFDYNLFCIIGIGFRTLTPESNCLGSCFFVLCHCHWKWFPDSHPWTIQARILLFCTIRNLITVMLLIAPDCSSSYLIYIWHGYNLFFGTVIAVDLGHDLLSISQIGFHTRSSMELARILLGMLMHSIKALLGIAHKLYWPIFDLDDYVLSISHIGFQIFIPECDQLGSC